jgi:folate-dependent phosphoribosylglycinamide formyltransferase PurN
MDTSLVNVVLLTGDHPTQAALSWKIHRALGLAGIVIAANVPRRPPAHQVRRTTNAIGARTVGRPLVEAWRAVVHRYEQAVDGFPPVPLEHVANVNDRGTLEALERWDADLVAVSGTTMVGGRVLRAAQASAGALNLHTGISPYVKGGPNCTNWCLALRTFHLIGNTVMWIDPGVDSGNLVATERTTLDGTETLAELHWKVMEHAHDIYGRAIEAVVGGRSVPNVPQSQIGDGPTFRNADWTPLQMSRAIRNFRRHYRNAFVRRGSVERKASNVTLVSLESASRSP